VGRAQRVDEPRQGAGLTQAAELWSKGDYDALAERFAPIHDRLVERLDPQPGDRWLDVATGTGRVAARAAAAGAEVVGTDIAPRMLEIARTHAPEVAFELGDAQALSYEDASFDAVSSCFGVIFAPDHEATASELARVCRGRLGLTSWRPDDELRELYERFESWPPEGKEPFEWGRREHVEGLLGGAFDLEIEEGTWYLEGGSGEELWEFWRSAAPPFKAMVDEMDETKREAFRKGYIEYAEGHRQGDLVRPPRKYLLLLGRRR
jgi:SAM-dependent methyltransferase